MTKIKMTSREIKANYINIINVGNQLNFLLSKFEPVAYNAGVYGWNYDIIEVDENTFISAGYRAIGNIKPKLTLTRDFDAKAINVRNNPVSREEQKKKYTKLLKDFVSQALQA